MRFQRLPDSAYQRAAGTLMDGLTPDPESLSPVGGPVHVEWAN
jgi:hypothetical protein